MIRVALRSPRRLFRDALAGCLRARPEYMVVGSVAALEDLPALCELRHPDVALVDVGDGLDAQDAQRLEDCAGFARIIVIYERLSPTDLDVLRRIGIDTMIPGSHGLEAVLMLVQRYVAAYRDHLMYPGVSGGLTDEEEKIISLLGAGRSANGIARMLGISASAVAHAKRRIYRKLEVTGQCQVVARATTLGLLDGPASPPSTWNGAPLGAVCGAAGPTRDQVAATLLAGGALLSIEDTAASWKYSGERPGQVITVLVDPEPADWPAGREPVVLVLSTQPSRVQILGALLRGALAVLTADRAGADLLPALTLAMHGYLAIERTAANALLDVLHAPPGGSGLPELTAREGDILRSIAKGHTVRLTARALGIAEKTVENTQARLFRKLGAHNRSGALAAAYTLGLLDSIPTAVHG